jgi:hypothetical protein
MGQFCAVLVWVADRRECFPMTNLELLVTSGLVTREEMETCKPAPGSQKATPPLTVAAVSAVAGLRGNFMRPEADAKARFEVGQQVRARNMNPVGHTRLPRYARGKKGTVVRRHGIFVFPDTNARKDAWEDAYRHTPHGKPVDLANESS